jgi:hypothetical protein
MVIAIRWPCCLKTKAMLLLGKQRIDTKCCQSRNLRNQTAGEYLKSRIQAPVARPLQTVLLWFKVPTCKL